MSAVLHTAARAVPVLRPAFALRSAPDLPPAPGRRRRLPAPGLCA